VLDSGVVLDGEKRLPFYVMPLYKGTLRTVIKEGLAPDRVLPLFDQILSGVEAAHLLGVYHRDLKPENILCDLTKKLLVVADFGIAHFEQEDLLTAVETKDQERLANFNYAAPEQRIRGGEVDRRADIFALGLILNEMFTGSVPLAQGYPLIAGVSPSHAYLDEIVGRMIQHSAANRYPTVAKMKEELLARGQAFVALQKLDEVRSRVVPAAAPNDPLGGEDVKVVNFEYEPGKEDQPGQLIFATWRIHFSNLNPDLVVAGIAEPILVRFYQKTAVVGATELLSDRIVPMVKSWVSLVNEKYREQLRAEADKQHQARIAVLRAEQARAEEKARVTERLSRLRR
jgi:serine/threonine protein kinase